MARGRGTCPPGPTLTQALRYLLCHGSTGAAASITGTQVPYTLLATIVLTSEQKKMYLLLPYVDMVLGFSFFLQSDTSNDRRKVLLWLKVQLFVDRSIPVLTWTSATYSQS